MRIRLFFSRTFQTTCQKLFCANKLNKNQKLGQNSSFVGKIFKKNLSNFKFARILRVRSNILSPHPPYHTIYHFLYKQVDLLAFNQRVFQSLVKKPEKIDGHP